MTALLGEDLPDDIAAAFARLSEFALPDPAGEARTEYGALVRSYYGEPPAGPHYLHERRVRRQTCPMWIRQSNTMLTFGSLFAGIGGIDLGLERAGMRCAWQVELDDYARRVLTKRYPDVPKFRDVRDCGAGSLPPVDLIAGGFPCQDISNAGKRAGIDGERSGLWGEYVRIVGELRPRYVLVENVAALLGRGMGRVLGDLAALGYDAEWECIPAAAVGAPHIRERVFILAYAQSGGWGARGAGRSLASGSRQPEQPLQDVADTDGQRCDGRRGILEATEQTRRLLTQGDHAWRVEPGVGRVAYGVPARVDRLRGLGNAVVPQVAEFIGRAIIASPNNP